MITDAKSDKGIRSIFDEWKRIQESLAEITGLSFVTFDKKGRIRAEGGENDLCRLLAGGAKGKQKCLDSCQRTAQQSRRENRTIFFRCQAGLQCFALPIRIDGHPVAAVLGGRILEKAPEPAFFQHLARELAIPEEKVLQAVGGLQLNNTRALARVAGMVEQTAEVLFASVYHHNLVQRRLDLMTNLFHLGTDLSPEKEALEIYALVVNTVSILFDVEGAFFSLADHDGGPYRTRTAFGSAQPHCLHMELAPEGELMGGVVKDCAPLLTNDYHQILRSGFPEHVRRVALFPFFFDEKVRGLLVILNTHIDEDAVKLIFSFCCTASTAIQNTILRQELKRKVEEAARLVRVQNTIHPIMDRDKLLEAIFNEITRLTTAEQASLMLLNRQTNELIVKLAKGNHSPVIRNMSLGRGEGLAGKVARQGTPLLVTDCEKDQRITRKKRPRYRSNSFLIVPILVANRVVAVVNLTDKTGNQAFTPEDLESLTHLLSHSTIALQRSELYEMTRRLKRISATDPLTQLLNRRYFERRSKEEMERAVRYSLPLSLVMIDLDDFKNYNDTHGHLAGDNLLVGISNMIRKSVRNIDVVSRLGGEEFAVLSPQTGTEEAMHVAERVREAVHYHPFPNEEQQPLGLVSLSAGVATYPNQASSLEDLLTNADRALYRAKSAGKNRVLLYQETSA